MTTLDLPAAVALDRPPSVAAKRGSANPQFLARLTGIFFILTFITSIPPVLTLYVPVLSDPAYILGAGRDMGLSCGAVLELLLIATNIGSAIALFPIARRQSEGLALGFVASRIIESAFIAMGIVSLLAIGTLRLSAGGADAGTMVAIGKALVAVHDWTFRLGPGVVCGLGNGLILGALMWRSKLIPRWLSILGLVGGPLILISGAAVMLGVIDGLSVWQGIATVPEFFWELGFGIWLTVRGFNPKALAILMKDDDGRTR
jgi:hypothetical protein